MAVSTRTASRLPEMSVEEMGDHFTSLVPGGKSSMTTGIWPLTNTSHCNRLVMTPPVQVAASRSFLRPRSASCFCLPEIAEDVGPVLLEGCVTLQSTLQHGADAVLGFRPRQSDLKAVEGVEELVGGWQRDVVD